MLYVCLFRYLNPFHELGGGGASRPASASIISSQQSIKKAFDMCDDLELRVIRNFAIFERFTSLGYINFAKFDFRACPLKNARPVTGLINVYPTRSCCNILVSMLLVDGFVCVSQIVDQIFARNRGYFFLSLISFALLAHCPFRSVFEGLSFL